jgi:tetratricopeptide (TPR) repeat protein
LHWAERGQSAEAKRCLELARQVYETVEHDGVQEASQGWRRDRIRVKVAQTYVLLGEPEHAALYEAGTAASELGKVAETRARILDDSRFDEQIALLDVAVASGDFDQVRQALAAYVRWYARSYGDASRRALLEKRIESAGSKLPVKLRVEASLELADTALQHADTQHALTLVGRARSMIDGVAWLAEDQVPMLGRLAATRHRCGDRERAAAEAAEARRSYEAKQATILDIHRATCLRALAETHATMGEPEKALELYRLATEAGVANPNSRPRAEDLAATCCSMAVHAIAPDQALGQRLRELEASLGNPW